MRGLEGFAVGVLVVCGCLIAVTITAVFVWAMVSELLV